MSPGVPKSALFQSLPPPWAEELLPPIRRAVADSAKTLVVLDDDPTGTQTVHDLAVLTTWDVAALAAEFARRPAGFYILTNTRSLPEDAAVALNREVAANLREAASATGTSFALVSRSDSTLRGHFPAETDALAAVLGRFDGVLLVPYFEAGGRYTVGDVHYVAEGGTLVPAGETPFARDSAFGYRASNLREWAAEKIGSGTTAEAIAAISLDEIRAGGPPAVRERLLQLPFGGICIVNAACPRDLEVVVSGLLQAESAGRRYLCRTAASFVATRLGLEPRPLWSPARGTVGMGGLIVVGSHVPKTTAQLRVLQSDPEIEQVEVAVHRILDPELAAEALAEARRRMQRALAGNRDVVLYTSRSVVSGPGPEESLALGRIVSDALVSLVRQLPARPRFLIAKGGITSSDIATHGLGIRRALVLGQLLPGVPVWELGPETPFPGLPYVVFPGNVGNDDALQQAVIRMRVPSQ